MDGSTRRPLAPGSNSGPNTASSAALRHPNEAGVTTYTRTRGSTGSHGTTRTPHDHDHKKLAYIKRHTPSAPAPAPTPTPAPRTGNRNTNRNRSRNRASTRTRARTHTVFPLGLPSAGVPPWDHPGRLAPRVHNIVNGVGEQDHGSGAVAGRERRRPLNPPIPNAQHLHLGLRWKNGVSDSRQPDDPRGVREVQRVPVQRMEANPRISKRGSKHVSAIRKLLSTKTIPCGMRGYLHHTLAHTYCSVTQYTAARMPTPATSWPSAVSILRNSPQKGLCPVSLECSPLTCARAAACKHYRHVNYDCCLAGSYM